MNKENLKRAIEYIKTIPQEKFDMLKYRKDKSDKEPECKTVGCIIGHCTILDSDNVIKNYTSVINVNEDKIIKWGSWGESFFGFSIMTTEWAYLFDSEWAKCKKTNTPEHAEYRMQKVLDGYKPSFIVTEFNKEKEYVN